jgi:hypothetical protein
MDTTIPVNNADNDIGSWPVTGTGGANYGDGSETRDIITVTS